MNALETILGHKTIREYSNRPIPEEIETKILEAAVRGSTTGNMQLYSIIINKEEEMKKKILPFHFNQKAVVEAPLVLTFCADFNRFNTWCRLRNAEPGYDNFQCFMWAVIDAVIATQNACIAAEHYGLGICYMGTVTYNAHELIKLYNLPKGVVPVTCITIGYPLNNPELTDRLPLKAVIHHETYKDYRKEDIDKMYFEKENSELTKKLLEENQLDNLAKVFTERRYTKKDNVHFADLFLKVIKEQGFL
ncbi:MAG: nitroreductase family protein [Bacteroidales bacterium]|mgnify:FL=1|nr:nitroreductase family protein [Bacteroidales bacterium]